MTNGPAFRLYREPERGRVAGVCAGIARYFGLDVGLVRFAWFLALVFFTIPTLVTYVALSMLLPLRPSHLFATPEEEARHRTIVMRPGGALHDLKHRFRELDQRLARMEEAVLSEEFDLRRRFRDIGSRSE